MSAVNSSSEEPLLARGPLGVAWLQQQWKLLMPLIVLSYLLLVSLLRYRRVNTMTAKMGYHNRESFSRMTTSDALKIVIYLTELEFPWVYFNATAFALFKASTAAQYGHIATCH